MKNAILKVTIGIIGLIVLSGSPFGSPSEQEKDVVVEMDFILPEIGKTVEFSIEDKQFKAVPAWSDSDLNALPVSMEKAIRVARKFLTDTGCKEKNYYLYECSLQRLYRIEDSKHWYWKVSFGDDSFPAALDLIVTIPVLLDGSVPEAKLSPLK